MRSQPPRSLGPWAHLVVVEAMTVASALALLGTVQCDCTDSFFLTASRDVEFGPDDLSHQIRIRLSPARYTRATVEVAGGVEVVAVGSQAGSAGAGGASPPTSAIGGLEIVGDDDPPRDGYVIRLERGELEGPFASTVTVTLETKGTWCGKYGEPIQDIRIEPID